MALILKRKIYGDGVLLRSSDGNLTATIRLTDVSYMRDGSVEVTMSFDAPRDVKIRREELPDLDDESSNGGR